MAVLSRDSAASSGVAAREWTAVFSPRCMLPVVASPALGPDGRLFAYTP